MRKRERKKEHILLSLMHKKWEKKINVLILTWRFSLTIRLRDVTGILPFFCRGLQNGCCCFCSSSFFFFFSVVMRSGIKVTGARRLCRNAVRTFTSSHIRVLGEYARTHTHTNKTPFLSIQNTLDDDDNNNNTLKHHFVSSAIGGDYVQRSTCC